MLVIERVSDHFTALEFTVSQAAVRLGIINTPSPEQWENIKSLAVNVLEPARKIIGPLRISSGFRCSALNRVIGGARNSQHLAMGMDAAADLIPLESSLGSLYRWIVNNAPFDQVIFEFGSWVHVSHRRDGQQRGHMLIAHRTGTGKTIYTEMSREQMMTL